MSSIDYKIENLLKENRIEEAKIKFDETSKYLEFYFGDCFKQNLEFTEYAFEKRPHLFLTGKTHYRNNYNISYARNGRELLRFNSDKADVIIDDLFNHDFERGQIGMIKYCIVNNLEEYFYKSMDKLNDTFRSKKALTKFNIQKYDRNLIEFKVNIIEMLTYRIKQINENFNLTFDDLMKRYPLFTDGVSNAHRASIIRRTAEKNKEQIQKCLFDRDLKPNEYWRINVKKGYEVTKDELKGYIDYIKRNPKLIGIRNLLKIDTTILELEVIELYEKEGILKKIAWDIARLYMNSTSFMGRYMERDIEKGKVLIEKLIDSGGVERLEIARLLKRNFDPFKSRYRTFHNEIGKNFSLVLDDKSVEGIKKFLLYLDPKADES